MQWGGESRRKVGLLRRQCELGRDGEVVDEKDIVFSVLTNQRVSKFQIPQYVGMLRTIHIL